MNDPWRTMTAIPVIFRVGISRAVAHRGAFLVWAISVTTPFVMLVFWSRVAEVSEVEHFDSKRFEAYFCATFLVQLLTANFAIWEMNAELRQGTLAARLLRPIHPFVSYAVDAVATLPARAALIVPVALAVAWKIGSGTLTHDGWLLAITPAALFGAWLVTFAAMLAVGSLGLFWESSIAVWELWSGLFLTCSGYIVPLQLFPSWLSGIINMTPFPYTMGFPVATMLGLCSRSEAIRSICLQWTYACFFFVLAVVLWRRGLKRFVAHGG